MPDSCKVAKLKSHKPNSYLTLPCNYKPTFATTNNWSYKRGYYSWSNQYFSKFEKLIIHLSVWFSKKHYTEFCLSYLNNKNWMTKGFDKDMMTSMNLIDLKVFDTIPMTYFCRNYMLLVFRSALLVGLNLISPRHLFWLI